PASIPDAGREWGASALGWAPPRARRLERLLDRRLRPGELRVEREAPGAERTVGRFVGREVPLHEAEDLIPEVDLGCPLPQAADPDDRASGLLDHLDQKPDRLARRDQVLHDEDLAALPDIARELVRKADVSTLAREALGRVDEDRPGR